MGGKGLARWRSDGTLVAVGILVVFVGVASWILMLRQDVLPYRVGQYVGADIHARVPFNYLDKRELANAQDFARQTTPSVYKANGEVWAGLTDSLMKLPDRMGDKSLDELPEGLLRQFHLKYASFTTDLDSGSVTVFDQSRTAGRRPGYAKGVNAYVQSLSGLVVLPESQRLKEYDRVKDTPGLSPRVMVNGADVKIDDTFSTGPSDEVLARFKSAAKANFAEQIQSDIVAFTQSYLAEHPTHVLDEDATAARQNEAARSVPVARGLVSYAANRIIKREGRVEPADLELLKAERDEYGEAKITSGMAWKNRAGIFGIVLVVALGLAGYVKHFQPRVVKNHARAVAIAALMLAMLLPAQLAGMGTGAMYLFGVAPTILVAMILAIAYDRRFAMGIATMHAILATVALDQSIGFFLVMFAGIFTCCYLLDDIRGRGKLIEVGGATAVALMIAAAVTGAASQNPIQPLDFIGQNILHAGAAGLAVGFIVLGILPFIEKAFRITTSLSLLEWADSSQPLMRRLSLEAPGTYNHSLQVATLAEEAAEAIGANSLLCRVGAYYHDIGKINKADYFIENQSDGVNRHINLSPSVSLLIIIGHVKDGVEMAREYNLPTSLFPFIQQHHGTTLVEYFYRQACANQEDAGEGPTISETQYRYPGPKPRMKEIALVMLADAVESATRAMGEPNANRIETLVRDMCMKRLLDGQFDDCDLTTRELDAVARSMIKSLVGIHHGRIPYPAKPQPQSAPVRSAARSA